MDILPCNRLSIDKLNREITKKMAPLDNFSMINSYASLLSITQSNLPILHKLLFLLNGFNLKNMNSLEDYVSFEIHGNQPDKCNPYMLH